MSEEFDYEEEDLEEEYSEFDDERSEKYSYNYDENDYEYGDEDEEDSYEMWFALKFGFAGQICRQAEFGAFKFSFYEQIRRVVSANFWAEFGLTYEFVFFNDPSNRHLQI